MANYGFECYTANGDLQLNSEYSMVPQTIISKGTQSSSTTPLTPSSGSEIPGITGAQTRDKSLWVKCPTPTSGRYDGWYVASNWSTGGVGLVCSDNVNGITVKTYDYIIFGDVDEISPNTEDYGIIVYDNGGGTLFDSRRANYGETLALTQSFPRDTVWSTGARGNISHLPIEACIYNGFDRWLCVNFSYAFFQISVGWQVANRYVSPEYTTTIQTGLYFATGGFVDDNWFSIYTADEI